MEAAPEVVVVQPTTKHTHTAILLHGRGDNGPDFAEAFLESETSPPNKKTLPQLFPSWKWIFPSAPVTYSTVFQGPLQEWFDIHSLVETGSKEELQISGLQKASLMIQRLIEEEAKILPLSKVILGGISQGCATSLHALLSLPLPALGAFVGFCGWMAFQKQVEEVAHKSDKEDRLKLLAKCYEDLGFGAKADTPELVSPAAPLADPSPFQTPILLEHAKDDAVIDSRLGLRMAHTLTSLGFKVFWHEYEEGGHWIVEPQGIDDLVEIFAGL